MEGLAGVLEADLPNYKSKILRILCTVYVCRRSGSVGGAFFFVHKFRCLRWFKCQVCECCCRVEFILLQTKEAE